MVIVLVLQEFGISMASERRKTHTIQYCSNGFHLLLLQWVPPRTKLVELF